MIAQVAPKRRDSARLLVINPEGSILLFRFSPLGREAFWATPGGGLDEGEDFATAARRELREETGLECDIGDPLATRTNHFEAHWGEQIIADEHFFVVQTSGESINVAGHDAIEQEIMKDFRWFSRQELHEWHETIFPADIAELLEKARSI